MPKAIWHVFLPKKKVQKTFELFFLQLPKKTYRGIFDTKSTSTCFSWAIAKRNLKKIWTFLFFPPSLANFSMLKVKRNINFFFFGHVWSSLIWALNSMEGRKKRLFALDLQHWVLKIGSQKQEIYLQLVFKLWAWNLIKGMSNFFPSPHIFLFQKKFISKSLGFKIIFLV